METLANADSIGSSGTSAPVIPAIEREALALKQVEAEIRRVIVGQDYLVERLLVGLLARGHVLIEGVPGLAKTLAAKTLARTLAIDFRRVQFTPDLLPADLVGTLIYDPRKQEFEPRRGPIFTNALLADEINRAPAKVQSALLEAMEERQVTLGDTTYSLPEPFLVLATQNPIEQEGTYPLAEAQIDRFLLKLVVGYPDKEEEKAIVRRMAPGMVAGSLLSTLAAGFLSQRVLALGFALIVYGGATQMLLGRKPAPGRALPGPIPLTALGLAIGVICGLVSAGGAFLTVPLMLAWGVVMRVAIGTAAAVGVPVAVVGMIGYVISGWRVPNLPEYTLGFVYLPALLAIVAASVLTAPFGARLAHRLPVATMKRVFALLLYLLATKMIVSYW
jgi:uncharacterized membrane protein YfcA